MSEAKNKVISVEYNLYKDTAKGELIESTEGQQPLVFLSGAGQMIPDFESKETKKVLLNYLKICLKTKEN